IVLRHFQFADMFALETQIVEPLPDILAPGLEQVLPLAFADKILYLHLFELAHAEKEVAGSDLIAESLADLGDAERQLRAHGVDHVLEVHKDALGGLGTKI